MQRNFYQTPYEPAVSGEESVIVPQTIEPEPVPVEPAVTEGEPGEARVSLYNPETKKFFDRFGVDDIILVAVILLLATDTETDPVILCILGVVFFLGLNG